MITKKTIAVDVEFLRALADACRTNGTISDFPALAIQWAEQADTEIRRLTAENARLRLAGHGAELATLGPAIAQIEAGDPAGALKMLLRRAVELGPGVEQNGEVPRLPIPKPDRTLWPFPWAR